MKRRNKTRNLIWLLLNYSVLILACVVTVLPMLYMIGTAFKGPVHILEFPPRFIPVNPTIKNFISAWQSNQFDRYFLNSIVVTVASTICTILLAALMSFAFAYMQFPGKRILFSTIIFFMTLPVMILLIPQFELAKRLDLIDSLKGLIVVYIAQNIPLATFILTGFFKQQPFELIEAAYIDGASAWKVFWQIIIPLSKPALATVTIFSSLGAWDEFVWANTIINTSNKRTLPVGIAAFQGVHMSNWGLIFAASIMAITPIVLLFIFMQRYFIKGAITGAIKG